MMKKFLLGFGVSVACLASFAQAGIVESVMSIADKVTVAGIPMTRAEQEAWYEVVSHHIIAETLTQNSEEQKTVLDAQDKELKEKLQKAGIPSATIKAMFSQLSQLLKDTNVIEAATAEDIEGIKKGLKVVLSSNFASARVYFDDIIEVVLTQQGYEKLCEFCEQSKQQFEKQKNDFFAQGYTEAQFEAVVAAFTEVFFEVMQKMQVMAPAEQ